MDNHFKERIRSINPIEEVVGELVPLKRNIGKCPKHQDRVPSFSVNPSRGICKCWAGCTADHKYSNRDGSLDVFGFYQWYYDCDFKEALEKLAARHGQIIPEQRCFEPIRKRQEPKPLKISLPESFIPLYQNPFINKGISSIEDHLAAARSLESRLVTIDQIEEYAIGYATEGLYENRLIFPVSVNGKLMGFAARLFKRYGYDERKYLYPKGMRKSACLFGYDQALRFDECVLVEGVFDVLRVGLDAVGILGSALSTEQLSLLYKARFHTITVILDGDAFDKSIKICQQLESYFRVFQVILKSRDPGSIDHEELRQLIRGATRFGSDKNFEEIINGRVHS